MSLLAVREKALDYRVDKERKYIKKLYKAQQMTPRTYTQRREQLERWVRVEMAEIERAKGQVKEEWTRTVQMIEET